MPPDTQRIIFGGIRQQDGNYEISPVEPVMSKATDSVGSETAAPLWHRMTAIIPNAVVEIISNKAPFVLQYV
jgi:hypothetical protein